MSTTTTIPARGCAWPEIASLALCEAMTHMADRTVPGMFGA